MTRTNEAVFAMFLKVRNFYYLHTDVLDTLPIIKQYFEEVKDRTGKILMADTGGRADLTGVTIMKSRLRNELQQGAQRVSNGLAAYAVVTKDIALQKRIDFPASKWYSISEEELVTQSKITLNLAIELAKDLTPYGVLSTDVNNLEEQLDNFVNNISGTSLAIDQRKADNSQVGTLIESTRAFLNEELDVLMRVFEINSPILHQLYLSARAIDVNGPVTQPTAMAEVKPNALMEVYNMPYGTRNRFTLRNDGREVVFFSLSETNTSSGKVEVALFPGETRSRLAENLAPAGSYLMVSNPGESSVQVKVWVE